MKKISGGELHCTYFILSLKNPKAGAIDMTVLVLNSRSLWKVSMLKGSNLAVGCDLFMDSKAFSMYDSKHPYSYENNSILI